MSTVSRLSELLVGALGPGISKLLKDEEISEIRLNSDGSVWGNRLGHGKFHSDIRISPENARRAIYAVAYGVGEICNEDKPAISAELPDTGERFQGLLPPLSQSPVFVIRKKAVRIFSLNDLELQGIVSILERELLEEVVLKRKNILIVGGTDSGKTTFANALLKVVSSTTDRIVVLEDTQELQCQAQDVEYLHTKDGVASLRDLIRYTMRMSPDRIVIGEVRGSEALDLLKAWNTGHPGGVSTIHANSAERGLLRIEQLVQEAGVVPSREMIAEAVNIIVYMEKSGTKRIVKNIMEIIGVKNGEYQLAQLMKGSLK
jgi:type IV secretion system protein VirB11